MTGPAKPRSALFFDYPLSKGTVYTPEARARIAALTDPYPDDINAGNFDDHAAGLADVEVIFATWGLFPFEARHFAALPKLKAVFYAAGNVKAFAQPLIDHDVILVSAWQANAIPVAEMCLSQILLSLRGYFRAVRQYHDMHNNAAAKAFTHPGVNGATIGLLGVGKIGTRLRHLLRDYPLKVIAFDPFLTAERAAALDIESVSLDAVFERSDIVSNHIPDIADTRGVLTEKQFAAMRSGASFINTGRGAQVVEEDLIRVLRARPDLTALLDVTMPEPPVDGSPLWDLPNVVISPHVGGTVGDECPRLSALALDEFERWMKGEPLTQQVTATVFATMG
ncbi:MAG: hydroxyacid dehydrogenase [Proteobacteria bacterium]|nr:hydroxyacid dehydrogenase [Pseudomonadota bacterium]